jgi:hypothetical protein
MRKRKPIGVDLTDAMDGALRNVTIWNYTNIFPQVSALSGIRQHHSAWPCCNIKWKPGNEPEYG